VTGRRKQLALAADRAVLGGLPDRCRMLLRAGLGASPESTDRCDGCYVLAMLGENCNFVLVFCLISDFRQLFPGFADGNSRHENPIVQDVKFVCIVLKVPIAYFVQNVQNVHNLW
jgi:hypothetical protein